jgi:hypothetical protein
MEIKIDSLSNLDTILNEYGIETKRWGLGRTKTLADLYKEIIAGETVLDLTDGKIVRHLHVVGITVTCGNFLLKEDRQVFTNGRVRNRELTVSCAEKMINGETPKESAIRCLKEELGIDVNERDLVAKVHFETEDDSHSYPGLKSIYYRNPFDYEMKPEFFKEEGYMEVQDNKTSYFIWVKQ